MATWSNGILSGSVSVSDKNSSGVFTVSASITNTSSGTIATGTPRISVSTDGGSSWTRILQSSTIGKGSSISGSASVSTGNTSSQTVKFSLLSDNLTGNIINVTVSGYVDPTPYMSPPSLGIDPVAQYIGQKVTITESGGSGYSVTERRVTVNGSTVGTFSTGQWTIPLSVYEPLCTTSNSITATLQTRCTAASGYAGSGNSNTVSLLMTIPANYLPTATHTYEFINPQNSSLVAGYSQLKVNVFPGVTPEENSAQVASCVLQSVTSTNTAITTASFTEDSEGLSWTSVVLPSLSGVPSYTLSLTFRVTDTRGNVCDYTTNEFRVTNFIPPYCYITNLKRDTATTGTLNVTIDSPSAAHLATVKVGSGSPVNVINQLVQTQTGYTLEYAITGLSSGNQYNVVFTYQDENMYGYGENPYNYTQLLSTLAMPLSLYDNGAVMAASFGEECADNYGQSCVINFAKDAYIRYIKTVGGNDTVVIDRPMNLFSSCPYNVGDIYITTLSSSPSAIWSGTTWEQLEDVFLLGAGSYTLGDTGGEAEHTLTVQEIPSHTHGYINQAGSCDRTKSDSLKTTGVENDRSVTTDATGGGQAHNNMPPYLVVNMWKRLS